MTSEGKEVEGLGEKREALASYFQVVFTGLSISPYPSTSARLHIFLNLCVEVK